MRTTHENARIRCAQVRHRSSSALILLSLAGTLGLTAVGCSGEGVSLLTPGEASPNEGAEAAEANDAVENAVIESHLEARGYDTSTLRFQDDKVIVEEDMLMSRALLLDQAEAEATGVVEKGYFIGTNRFTGKRIGVSFAGDVSNAWRTAFTTARDTWNRNTPMFAHDPGSTGTISVVMGTDLRDTFGTGSFPPNRTITLNRAYSGTCGTNIENIPAASKAYIALHEMGHVLGFDHPPPGAASGVGRAHIAGTATSAGTSVMRSGCRTGTLSADDILSAGKKYPSCMLPCENSCLFNVDPAQIGLCMSGCTAQCGG